MIKISREQLDELKWVDKVPLGCDYCDNELERTKRAVMKNLNGGHYCNTSCQGRHKAEKAKTKILERGTIKCTLCSEIKPLEEFNKNKSTSSGYNTVCRVCSNVRSKQYYHENKEHHKKVINERNKLIISENRKRLFNYYSNNPCVDCGETNPVVLESDHKDGVDKKYDISAMISHSWVKIEEELAKCDVRCANCHRIRTAKQFNWYKGILS